MAVIITKQFGLMKAIRTITLAGYILATIFINSCDERREVQVESPDANEIFYSLSFKGEEVIHASRLGFVFSKEKVDRPEISIEEVVRENVNSSWRPVYGERDEYPEVYSEIIISLREGEKNYRLNVRAYNEGVAFRYEFPDDNTYITR